MRDLQESGRPVDMITLIEELDRRKEVEAIGGVAYLSSLIDGVPDRPPLSTTFASSATRRCCAG